MIIQGDCIEEMKKMEDNSVDAIVTDPPYGLEFMGKDWDKFGISPARAKRLLGDDNIGTGDRFFDHRDGAGKRGRYTEMDLKEKNAFQEFIRQFSTEALRVLKPGGFLLSFGGTRTYHRMTCGIEDAGFEIRDCIMWIYGSGFPKSLNIGKQIDKMQGNEREVIGKKPYTSDKSIQGNNYGSGGYERIQEYFTKGNSEWEGWGTALKPAVEPIVVARKPLSEKNVALNVLKWGTGGINIDECRIGNEIIKTCGGNSGEKVFGKYAKIEHEPHQGRFPANIILDEEAGKMLDEQSGISCSKWGITKNRINKQKGFLGGLANKKESFNSINKYIGNKGGASRFFYCAKASKSERNLGCEELKETFMDVDGPRRNQAGFNSADRKPMLPRKNNHPTVKPIKLMEYLIKLVSKEGAVILDPFMGSGTTGIACVKLNRQFIGIEQEEDYVKIAEARINKMSSLKSVGEDLNSRKNKK